MPHTEALLAILDAIRCHVCGEPAARGATVCVNCAAAESDEEAGS